MKNEFEYHTGESPEAGDVVQCVEPVLGGSLETASVYTVERYYGGYVYLVNMGTENGWYPGRFSLQSRSAKAVL